MTKLQALIKQFNSSLKRMDEVLREKKTIFMRDAAIKRFEFTFDLAWKTIKAFLEEKKGISCVSPKDCFKEAFRQGLIEYDKLWSDIGDWRNEIAHEYSEEYADELYAKLPKVLELWKRLRDQLDKNGKKLL